MKTDTSSTDITREQGRSARETDAQAEGSGALSGFWRKNVSSSESVELANLLRALRKVTGYLGQNTGTVEYAGMAGQGGYSIIVDPDMVRGTYPVPPKKVDYLVGLVVHEALQRIEWTEHVYKVLEGYFKTMSPLNLVMFQKLVHTGENIYADLVADKSILGLYTSIARKDAIAAEKQKLEGKKPSYDCLLCDWWESAFEKNASSEPCAKYAAPLDELEKTTALLAGLKKTVPGVTARAKRRAEIYQQAWESIRESVSGLPVIDKRLCWIQDINTSAGQSKRKPARSASPKKLSTELAREIEWRLAEYATDITPIIRQVVGHDDEDVVPTSRWDFHIPARPVIDKRMVSRLKAAFQNYSARKKLVSRGLESGSIDKRRLYRAPVNGKCFYRKEEIPDPDWCVSLLMDASGSMRGYKWKMVENTVGNLHKALAGYHNRLRAYAYFEMDGVCMISKLISGNQLMTVPPQGQTASGQAIIAAAHMMPAENRRNLLVHVTDGESNFGCGVEYGIDYCAARKINLVTLGCGCKDREKMKDQYGKTIRFLDHYGQLPSAVESLLKWTFLYSSGPQHNRAVRRQGENGNEKA